MASVGKQQFSSDSFAGLGSRPGTSLASVGRLARFGGSMGIVSGGGLSFGSSGYGKGFGGGGGGGGMGFSGASTRRSTLGSGLSSAGVAFSRMSGTGDGALGMGTGGGGFGSGTGGDVGSGLAGNGKVQMQSLNDRLAVFLEKVRVLEASNRELEEKLRTANVKNVVAYDFTGFDAKINPLLEQLLTLMIQRRGIALQIDNARLTADDFKLKWETELSARQMVEGDIAGLQALQRDYNQYNKATMTDLQALTDQRTDMKKDHEQELETRRGSMSGVINVNVQPAKSVDLASVMTDLREEYESVMERNKQQAENWYTKQVEIKQEKLAQETHATVSGCNEIKDLRKQALILQTQLEALRKGNLNMETRMAELKGQFQMQLQRMSHQKDRLEDELSSVRQSVGRQGQEYQNLLNIKSHLEMEIRTYKQLLEGSDVPMSSADVGASVGMKVAKTSVSEVKTARSGGASAISSGEGGRGTTTVKMSSRTSSSSTGGTSEMPSGAVVTSSRERPAVSSTSVITTSTSADATYPGGALLSGSVTGATMTSSGGVIGSAITPSEGCVTSLGERSTVQTDTTTSSTGYATLTAGEAPVLKSLMPSGGGPGETLMLSGEGAGAAKILPEGGAVKSVGQTGQISTAMETPHTVTTIGNIQDAPLAAGAPQKSLVSLGSATDAAAISEGAQTDVAMMIPGGDFVNVMPSENAAAVHTMSLRDAAVISSKSTASPTGALSRDPAAVHLMSSGDPANIHMTSSGEDPASLHMISSDSTAVHMMASGDLTAIHMMSLGDPTAVHMSLGDPTAVHMMSSGDPTAVHMMSSGEPAVFHTLKCAASTTVMSTGDANAAATLSSGVPASVSVVPSGGGSGVASTAAVSIGGAERVEAVSTNVATASVMSSSRDSGAAVVSSGGMAMSTEGVAVEAAHATLPPSFESSSSGGIGMLPAGAAVDSGAVAMPGVEALTKEGSDSSGKPAMK